MPEYDSGDVEDLLGSSGISCIILNHKDIETLKRKICDIVILPYVRGNFSDRALASLVKYHADGGSLFFLGDLPNKDKWFPLKNMQAAPFHLTRCYDDFNISSDRPGIEGLTPKGREIIGMLEDTPFFEGKAIPGLRVTAFPPDITYPLIRIHSASHAENSSSIAVVERKCEKFLGAKFAVIGFIGGEPRENVDGAYQKPWKFDPGLLTRRWKGINSVVLKIIKWLQPAKFAAAIDVQPVSREGETKGISILLKNISDCEIRISKMHLCLEKETVWKSPPVSINPMAIKKISCPQISRCAGIHQYSLFIENDLIASAESTERVIPGNRVESETYGFSTYWSFQKPQISDEFRFFCDEMQRRGCQYLRANIPWEEIEPAPGKYDWRITDEMLKYADKAGLALQFWLFPTTRGSGLGDGGVPWWSLREPAIDRNGNKGFFPSLWSPFYRNHYFEMLEHLTKRYAMEKTLKKFVLDFGNSDFPYGYYYYVNDTSLFDYSKFERKAFASYLKNELEWDMEKISLCFGKKFRSFADIPVPFVEESEPWRVYLDFRTWSISQGNLKVREIVRKNAPAKLPPDPPGHGLGSIADIGTYFCESKAKHWLEERKFDPKHVETHNFGKTWGGEPWQVGGEYRQYADALFQSVRLNADYFTIPGADLGLYGEDIAKIGFIRRTLAGAVRQSPRLAVFDRTGWNEFTSLANIATRLDIPADLISAKHRYDFSCYRLMTLPDCDYADRTVTGGGGGMLVPTDEQWFWLLRESVEKGLNLLVFPGTCTIGKDRVQRTFLRQVFGLENVRYGKKMESTVKFPKSFGGGTLTGNACEVSADGTVLLLDSSARPILVRKNYGLGSVLIAGYDSSPESLDPVYNYEMDERIKGHTLVKLCTFLGIVPERYNTDNLLAFKEMINVDGKEYFIILSYLKKPVVQTVKVRLSRPARSAFDLATGERCELRKISEDFHEFDLALHPRMPRFMSFHDKFPCTASSPKL